MARHGVERHEPITWYGLVNGQPALYDPKTEELSIIQSPFDANQILARWPQRQLEHIVGKTIEATSGIWSNRSFYFFLYGKELQVKMTITSTPAPPPGLRVFQPMGVRRILP